MPGLTANERRIVELVLKASGDAELKRMVAELKATRTAAEGAQRSLGGIGAGLSSVTRFAGGFISALGVSTIISWGRAILDAADALDAAAEQAGIGVERYQTLKQAFRTLEVDTREFETGMERLGVVLADVLNGETNAATKALDRLGIKAKILSGEITDVEGVVDALGSTTKALNNDISLTSDLADILGKKLAGDYSSAFRSGALATEELRVATEKFGVVSEAELKTLADASETVEQAYNTVSNAILIATANTITGIQKYINALSDENVSAIVNNLNNPEALRRQAAIDRATGGQAALDQLMRDFRAAPSAAPARTARARGGGGGGGQSEAQREAQRRREEEEKKALKFIEDKLAAEREAIEAEEEHAKALSDYAFALERAADPMLDFNAGLDAANAALEDGRISTGAYAAEVRRLDADLAATNQAIFENSDAFRENQKALDEHEASAQRIRDQWEYVADAFGQATYDILSGTESISQAVRKMVADILAEVARIAAIKLAAQLVASLFGAPGVGKSAGTGGTGALKMFAAGGIITGPTLVAAGSGGIGIAGEAGPEVVAPLRRDGAGNLGVGAVAPRVTVNNYAGAEVRTSTTPEGLQIDILRRVVADDIRRGGTAISGAIEGAYRVGRQAGAFG